MGVLLKTGLPADDATAIAESIVADIAALIENDDSDMLSVDVQRTPKGPAILLTECGDLDRVLGWISDGLTNRGLDTATMTTMPIVRPFHGHGILTGPGDEIGVISGYLCLRGVQGAPIGLLKTWSVSEQDAEDAIESLVNWALELPGAEPVADLCTSQYTTRVLREDLLAAIRTRARDRNPMRLQTNEAIVYAGNTFRSVEVLPTIGLARVSQGSELPAEFAWQPALADITSVLHDAGPWCSYGHATRGFSPPSTVHPYHGSRGGRWLADVDQVLTIADHKLFDAFAVMRLSRPWAEQMPLRPDWTLVPARDDDYVIAEHTRPASWFGEIQIDPHTLTEGRATLADHLLDTSTQDDSDTWAAVQRQWANTAARWPGRTPQNYWERRK